MSRLKLEDRNKSCRKFSKILNRVINLTNITKSQFSSKTGVSPALISNYLLGRSTPNWAILERISTRLKIDPSILFGAGDDKSIPDLSLTQNSKSTQANKKTELKKRGRPKKIEALKTRGRPRKNVDNAKT